MPDDPPHLPDDSDADWFRAPTRRENLIAAALFTGFAIFFALLFVVLRGWWFRWVIITLSAWSLIHALRHLSDSRHAKVKE
jgi:hypothetical protein